MTVSEYPDVPATGDGESRRVDLDDLVSLVEIRDFFDVPGTTVYSWTERADFPQPVARFGKKFRIWLLSEVRTWRDTHPAHEPLEHGLTGYARRRCRCDICRAANTEQQRRYRLSRQSVASRTDRGGR